MKAGEDDPGDDDRRIAPEEVLGVEEDRAERLRSVGWGQRREDGGDKGKEHSQVEDREACAVRIYRGL